MIIQDGTELADHPDGKGGLSEPRVQQECAITAQELLTGLEQFHLDHRTLRELGHLIELLRHRRAGELVRPVRYGLLLQCELDGYGRAFLTAFSQLLEQSGLLDGPPEFLCEEVDGHQQSFRREEDDQPSERNRSILRVVQDCRPMPEVNKLESPSAQGAANRALQNWEVFWEDEERFLRENPNRIGVAIVGKAAIRSGWKQHEHLFYRVYGHHIFLNDLPAEDIQAMVYQRLADLGLAMDETFVRGLGEYVRVVYPETTCQ